MLKPRVVTIDGPAGAGKSTVAGCLADRLGWRLLDTGAMYRAVTLAACRAGVDLRSHQSLVAVASRIRVTLPPGRVLLDGEDVTQEIRGVAVTQATRHAADSPGVRSRLIEWQREFARSEERVVTEGRDQGTIVFPDAFRKFFLTAGDLERARRRHAEYAARGDSITEEAVRKDLRERDAQDAARSIAPMKPAPDARIVDSTGLDLDQIVSTIQRDILQALEAGE